MNISKGEDTWYAIYPEGMTSEITIKFKLWPVDAENQNRSLLPGGEQAE